MSLQVHGAAAVSRASGGDERPAACVVLKGGASVTEGELRELLGGRFAKFWLPDVFLFMEALPKTATGKYLKSVLRAQLRERPPPG